MSGIWPGETQCVVLLGFDVDGVSSWLNRNPDYKKLPSLMSMAEYGPSAATPRILDLLDEHGIKAVENRMHFHDLHATLLHLMGLNHEKLTYRYAGRDFRLTDVHGNVAKEILS